MEGIGAYELDERYGVIPVRQVYRNGFLSCHHVVP